MSERDDGGPAFPVKFTGEDRQDLSVEAYPGMMLRDWFAGQALASMVTDHCDTCDGYRNAVARHAYQVADAMLAERAKDK